MTMRTISVKRVDGTTVEITPTWMGQGIVIHYPVVIAWHGGFIYHEVHDLWHLTHVNTGLKLGACIGSLRRAQDVAEEWDAEFAALHFGDMAPDRIAAWRHAVDEMNGVKDGRMPLARFLSWYKPAPLYKAIQ